MIKFYRYPRVIGNTTHWCYGMRIWKWRNFTMEIWYIPKGVSLPIHRHPNQHINLIPLVMDRTCVFNRRHVDKNHLIHPSWRNMDILATLLSSLPNTQSIKGKLFRAYTTPDGYYHWFSYRTKAIIFLNTTRWLNGVKPTSPSKCYVTLKDDLIKLWCEL